MEGVKRGADRQQLHEIVRECSMAATAQMKNGEPWDLLGDLSQHPQFGMTREEMEAVLAPEKYTGRCAEQVERYLETVRPLLTQVPEGTAEIDV